MIPGGGAVAGAITDATLLVKPDVALAQEPDLAKPEDREPTDPSDDPVAGDGPGLLPPDGPDHTHYHGVAQVNSERYGRDFTRISQEILQHLSAMEGVDLNITVEIRASKSDGFPADKVRVILENANALKFDHSTFESD